MTKLSLWENGNTQEVKLSFNMNLDLLILLLYFFLLIMYCRDGVQVKEVPVLNTVDTLAEIKNYPII